MLTVASIFRDSTSYLERYFSQVRQLDCRLLLAEGDSTDGTYEALKEHHPDALIKADHNGHKYGSIDHPQRWQDIAFVVRRLIDRWDGKGTFLWVESDLIWDALTMKLLIGDLYFVPAVAPQVKRGDIFYDTWGFRKNGQQFPQDYQAPNDLRVKIDSCGSCFAINNPYYLRDWDGVWPFTAQGNLWLDPLATIYHP